MRNGWYFPHTNSSLHLHWVFREISQAVGVDTNGCYFRTLTLHYTYFREISLAVGGLRKTMLIFAHTNSSFNSEKFLRRSGLGLGLGSGCRNIRCRNRPLFSVTASAAPLSKKWVVHQSGSEGFVCRTSWNRYVPGKEFGCNFIAQVFVSTRLIRFVTPTAWDFSRNIQWRCNMRSSHEQMSTFFFRNPPTAREISRNLHVQWRFNEELVWENINHLSRNPATACLGILTCDEDLSVRAYQPFVS